MCRRHRFVCLDDANPHFFSRGVSAWVEEAEDGLWADIILFLILKLPFLRGALGGGYNSAPPLALITLSGCVCVCVHVCVCAYTHMC